MRPFLRALLAIVACVVALVLLIRFVGSPIVTHFANQKLAAMPQFVGHVDAVQLALWRGTVTVRNLQLSDRTHPEDGVIVAIPHGMLSLAWAPIFRGRLGGEGSVENLRVLMVKRAKTVKDEEQKAKTLAKPIVRAWQDVLAKQFPIEFSRITTKNGQLRFDDRSSPGVVNLTIDNIDMTMAGFSNRQKSNDALPATVQMRAVVGGSGNLVVDGRADASQRQPTFEIRMELKGLSLPQIHDFLVRYALVDVSSGVFDLYTEAQAAHGSYEGYTKPFFKYLKFKAVPDPEKSFVQRAGTEVAAVVKDLLKNDEGNVATKAPFHGDFENNTVDVWMTIENLLRNAFIQALREGLEGQPASAKAR